MVLLTNIAALIKYASESTRKAELIKRGETDEEIKEIYKNIA